MRPYLLACCLALGSSAEAADLYRWVDDQGRTQLSDVVPEKYRTVATKIDFKHFELTDAQRAEADARAARARQRTVEAAASQPKTRNQVDPPPVSSLGVAPKPKTQATGDKLDCESQWRLYRESLACFAPYYRANHSLRSEAFENCTELRDPSDKCSISSAP